MPQRPEAVRVIPPKLMHLFGVLARRIAPPCRRNLHTGRRRDHCGLSSMRAALQEEECATRGMRGAVYVDIHGQGVTVVEEGRLDRPDTMYAPVVYGQVSGLLQDE